MPQITLDLEPTIIHEVARALENHAAYLRAYRSDGLRARVLEEVAEQILRPADKRESTDVIKKPVGKETVAAKKRLRA